MPENVYEEVYEMIDQARVVGISKCPCRESEQKCDAPREGCMIFGATFGIAAFAGERKAGKIHRN
jgi:hypothetical protein